GDEEPAAGGDDRATLLLRSRGIPGQARILAERNSPAVFTGVEVDRAQRPPRRLDRWQPSGISPPLVTNELVRRFGFLVLARVRRCRESLAYEVGDDGALLVVRQIHERRHESSTEVEHLLNLLRRETLADLDERWRPLATAPVRSVAARAHGAVTRRAGAGGGR